MRVTCSNNLSTLEALTNCYNEIFFLYFTSSGGEKSEVMVRYRAAPLVLMGCSVLLKDTEARSAILLITEKEKLGICIITSLTHWFKLRFS